MDYHPDITKNEIVTFAATWVDVKIILLKEAKDKYHITLLILEVTNISPQPVRNPSTQQEVSEGRAGKTSSAAPQSPHRSHCPLNHPSHPCAWKNCLLWNWSQVPKTLGATGLYAESEKKKKNKWSYLQSKKVAHRYRKQSYGYQRGKDNGGRDKLGSWD